MSRNEHFSSFYGHQSQQYNVTNFVNCLKCDNTGMCFTNMPKIYIEFIDAPSAIKEPNRRFSHIHIFYTTNNLWDSERKILKY